jgi:hypothetical protein
LDSIPYPWIAVMKQAIQTISPAFSMRRMIKDYVHELYVPAYRRGQSVDANDYALAKTLAAWRREIRTRWGSVTLDVSGPRDGQLAVGQPVEVLATLRLGDLKPEDVRVELVVARDEDGVICDRYVQEMERVKSAASTGKEAKDSRDTVCRYIARMVPHSSGSLIYGVRVVPSHPGLAHPYGMGMAHWA